MKAKKFRVRLMCVSGYYKGHPMLQDVVSNTESQAKEKALRYLKNSHEPNISQGKYEVESVEDALEADKKLREEVKLKEKEAKSKEVYVGKKKVTTRELASFKKGGR